MMECTPGDSLENQVGESGDECLLLTVVNCHRVYSAPAARVSTWVTRIH